MDITTLKKVLPYCFKAKVPVFVWGVRGIGKSDVAREYAAEHNMKFIDVRLGLMADQGDLCGIPDGRDEHGRILYTKPWFFPLEEDGPTLLFFDEFNRTPPQLLNSVFQLVLDRRINNHKLPDQVVIMAAGNPPNGDYSVTDIEKALMGRFIHFELRPQEAEFMNYASAKKFRREITDFLASSPQSIGYDHNAIKLEITPHPRAWEQLERIYAFLPRGLWGEVVNGLIGFAEGAKFTNHLAKGEKPVRARDIVDDYSAVRPAILSQSNIENKKVRSDLLNETLRDFDSVLFKDGKRSRENEIVLTTKQKENIVEFLKDVPKEFLITFTRNYIVCHNDIGDYLCENPDIDKAIDDVRISDQAVETDKPSKKKK